MVDMSTPGVPLVWRKFKSCSETIDQSQTFRPIGLHIAPMAMHGLVLSLGHEMYGRIIQEYDLTLHLAKAMHCMPHVYPCMT
jgi:hypothetical protein